LGAPSGFFIFSLLIVSNSFMEANLGCMEAEKGCMEAQK
jgi:hypothetical protein